MCFVARTVARGIDIDDAINFLESCRYRIDLSTDSENAEGRKRWATRTPFRVRSYSPYASLQKRAMFAFVCRSCLVVAPLVLLFRMAMLILFGEPCR